MNVSTIPTLKLMDEIPGEVPYQPKRINPNTNIIQLFKQMQITSSFQFTNLKGKLVKSTTHVPHPKCYKNSQQYIQTC